MYIARNGTIAAAIAMLAWGCSASGGNGGGGGNNPTHDSSTSATDAATTPPTDGNVRTPPDVQYATDGAVQADGQILLTPDSSCAAQTSGTTRVPMNLLILLDRSGSMSDCPDINDTSCGDSERKWARAVAAVNRLLALLAMNPDGTRVGLTLFPSDSHDSAPSGYTTPVVAIGSILTTGPMISSVLAQTGPTGTTPMACAEQGTIDFYENSFSMDGSRNVLVMTDGQPSEECSGQTCGIFDITCQANASNAAQIRVLSAAAAGTRNDPPIRTYAIGVPPADQAYLSSFALNGGTARSPGCNSNSTCAYSTAAATFDSDLNMALDDIRGRAATCEFNIMVDTTTADPGLINVNFTPAAGSDPTLIPRDVSHTDGWDYSDGMHSVILYGPSCDQVRNNSTGGSVQILFGCPTVAPG